MADVIHLEADVPSPVVGYLRPAEPFDSPISDADRAAAIDRATGYADRHGINKIYVVV
jgi:hypothetical protein